jgi:hypothetical protein
LKSEISHINKFWVLKLNWKTVAIGFMIDLAAVFLFWSAWAAVVVLFPQYELEKINNIHQKILKESEEFKKNGQEETQPAEPEKLENPNREKTEQ